MEILQIEGYDVVCIVSGKKFKNEGKSGTSWGKSMFLITHFSGTDTYLLLLTFIASFSLIRFDELFAVSLLSFLEKK